MSNVTVDVVRAAPQNVDSNGNVFQVNPNVGAVGPKGLQVFGAGTNLCLQSQTIATGSALTSPWSTVSDGSVPIYMGAEALAPDGTTTATRVDFPAISGATTTFSVLYQMPSIATGVQTISLWARTVTGSGVLYFNNDEGGGGSGNPTACNLTTSWQRFTNTVTSNHACYVFIGPNGIAGSGQPTTQPALSVYLWGVQVEAAPYASPYVPTTTAAVSWPATTATTPRAIVDGDNWAIGIKASNDAWGQPSTFLFSSNGGTNPNNWLFYWNTPDSLNFDIYDATGGRNTQYTTGTVLSPGEHTFIVAVDNTTRNIDIYIDGVKQATTYYGTSKFGITAQPPVFALGNNVGTSQFNGCISRFVQGNSYQEVAIALNQPDPYEGSGLLNFVEKPVPDGLGKWPIVARGGGDLTVTRAAAQTVASGANVYSVGSGTGGVGPQGLQVFGAGTNLCLQSQALATSPWVALGAGAATPVVTNNAATAPDGSTTATQTDFGAIAGSAQRSIVYQNIGAILGSSYTVSFWARTVAGTGTLYVEYEVAGNAPTQSFSLTTAWQRFVMTCTPGAAGASYLVFGTDGQPFPGSEPTTQPALSCYIWGVQVEASPFASPYQPTLASAVSWPITIVTATAISGVTASAGVIGASFICPGAANTRVIGVSTSGAAVIYFGDVDVIYTYDGTYFVGPINYVPNTKMWVIVAWSGSILTLYGSNGQVVTGPFNGNWRGNWDGSLSIGSYAGGPSDFLNGYISKVVQGTTVEQVLAELEAES